jgi:hypothetical protein
MLYRAWPIIAAENFTLAKITALITWSAAEALSNPAPYEYLRVAFVIASYSAIIRPISFIPRRNFEITVLLSFVSTI